MSEDMYQVSRILSAFLTYVLVLLRCGCLILFAPFFSSEVFPGRVRLMFAMAFSLLFIGVASRTAQVPRTMDMMALFLLAGQEFTLGMSICFLGTLIFTGVQLAGEMAGQQIGFSMANVLDPQSGIDMPMLGLINMNLTITMFITANLHLVFIYILMQSYEFVGIGALLPDVNFNSPVLSMGYAQATGLMRLGLQMAMPIMLIMLMNSIVEGFVTKTMPQMNIQVLGMPLRVILGMTALIFVYPAMCMFLVPGDWNFNLVEMPEGPLGNSLLELSQMVRDMGGSTGGN